MDCIRVSKVEQVICSKAGSTLPGTVHLTTHHLIFAYDDAAKDEMWVPYPIVSLVTRLPQTLVGLSPLTIRSRTFETFTLSFKSEKDTIDVFESIKELTVATSITQLYAFFYTPNPPFSSTNGWSLYSPREEFGRMGVGTRTKAWRFTDINKDYSFCSTYPAKLVVPTKISDTTLQYASKYRSKCRVPALTYLHWANYGSITRSSQPMVGLTANRSIQDEKLIQAVFQTHYSPDSRASHPVYGATATNLIIDARPTTNAVANTAKGAGTENMDHYREAKKAYLGIDNIHTMRDSLAKVVDALRETEMVTAHASGGLPGESSAVPILDRQALRRSGWLRHLSAIVEGSVVIVRNVHINSSHVLIHCSDGWDRTAQLSSISQLCLDPFYRTFRGFQILIEKDWVSFGHKFLDRCGHLSSEKFFVAPVENGPNASGAEAAQAFFASVSNRFASQSHLKETSPVFHQFLECVRQIQRQFPERFEFNERFLRQIFYHLYSCQFGTFLCNSERERRIGEGGPPICDSTVSVWDFFNSAPEDELNINPDYDPSLDDSNRPQPDMGVLLPNPKDIRFWHELYGRTDEEMNGKFVVRQVEQNPEFVAQVESVEDDPVAIQASATPNFVSLPPSPSRSPAPSLGPPSAITSSPPSLAKLALHRSESPTLAGGSSGSPPQGSRARHDSTIGSAYTLKMQGSFIPRSPSPNLRSSSLRSPPSPRMSSALSSSDLFSSGGVRSMWGKFSSNATAALSVVQDAYGGVTKDFKGISLGAGSSISQSDIKEGELKTREEIGAWSSEERSDAPRGVTSLNPVNTTRTATNPWSTTARSASSRPSLPSMFLDNPWSSVRSPSPDLHPSLGEIPFASSSTSTDTKPLPPDPLVLLPTPSPSLRSRPSLLSTSVPITSGSPASGLSLSLPEPLVQTPRQETLPPSTSPPQPGSDSTSASDPLGVGLL